MGTHRQQPMDSELEGLAAHIQMINSPEYKNMKMQEAYTRQTNPDAVYFGNDPASGMTDAQYIQGIPKPAYLNVPKKATASKPPVIPIKEIQKYIQNMDGGMYDQFMDGASPVTIDPAKIMEAPKSIFPSLMDGKKMPWGQWGMGDGWDIGRKGIRHLQDDGTSTKFKAAPGKFKFEYQKPF